MIFIKRAYEPAEPGDGPRFLVDRLWPRGVKKEALEIKAWLKEAGPSHELRTWFNHDPQRWKDFQRRYSQELTEKPQVWQPLYEASRAGDLTLIFSAHDIEHNNAVALRTFLLKRLRNHRRASQDKRLAA